MDNHEPRVDYIYAGATLPEMWQVNSQLMLVIKWMKSEGKLRG